MTRQEWPREQFWHASLTCYPMSVGRNQTKPGGNHTAVRKRGRLGPLARDGPLFSGGRRRRQGGGRAGGGRQWSGADHRRHGTTAPHLGYRVTGSRRAGPAQHCSPATTGSHASAGHARPHQTAAKRPQHSSATRRARGTPAATPRFPGTQRVSSPPDPPHCTTTGPTDQTGREAVHT